MTFKATIVVLAAVALVGTLCANGASISSDYDPEDDIAATGPISKFLPGDEDQAIKSRLHKRSTCEQDNTDYNGNDLVYYEDASVTETWQLCSDLCRATQQCKYWTWFKDNYPEPILRGKCLLKTAKGNVQAEYWGISGSRSCGGDCWFGGWWC